MFQDRNCVPECVGVDAYAMSHLSAVTLATGWLCTRVDARAGAASMIYAAASLSQFTMPTDRSRHCECSSGLFICSAQ